MRASAERASLENFTHFHILLVLLILYLRTFPDLKVHLHIHTSNAIVITYGMALYINDSIPTKH